MLQEKGHAIVVQTQDFFKTNVQKSRTAIQQFEHDTMGRIEKLLGQVQHQLQDNMPLLAPLLERVKVGIDKADRAFKANVGIAVETLPIADYDSLNVRSIVRAVTKLSSDELELVREYEKANKNRITILTEINARI